MIRIKRFIVLVFAALLLSDACSYIRYAIKNTRFRVNNYYGIFTSMENSRIYNLALIYFLSVCILYFIFNFFKKER